MKSIMGKIQNKMYKETNGTLEKRFSKTSKKNRFTPKKQTFNLK